MSQQNVVGTSEKKLYDPEDNSHLEHLMPIAQRDAEGLLAAHRHYGNSWKKRGGCGAYFMLARKIDRLEKFLEENDWDIFKAMNADTRGEGIIDDIRDLRRYLLLIEAEARARGIECAQAIHRDNINETAKAAEKRYKPHSAGGIVPLQIFSGVPPVGEVPLETIVWHPDQEAPDRRKNEDSNAGRVVILEDRDPGPSGSVSDPQGRS